ncbi:hypothetical protein [Haladaptatus sp. NG-WS-4]
MGHSITIAVVFCVAFASVAPVSGLTDDTGGSADSVVSGTTNCFSDVTYRNVSFPAFGQDAENLHVDGAVSGYVEENGGSNDGSGDAVLTIRMDRFHAEEVCLETNSTDGAQGVRLTFRRAVFEGATVRGPNLLFEHATADAISFRVPKQVGRQLLSQFEEAESGDGSQNGTTGDGNVTDPSKRVPDDVGGDQPGETLPNSTNGVENRTETPGDVDDTTDPVEDGAENTTDTVDDTTDQVEDGVDNTTDTVKDTIDETSDTVENTTDTVDETTDDVTDGVDDTTDTVENTTDETTDTVDNTTDTVDDTTDDVTDGVDNTTDSIEDTTKTVSDSVDDTKDTVENTSTSVEDTTSTVSDGVEDTVSTETTTVETTTTTDDTTDAVSDLTNQTTTSDTTEESTSTEDGDSGTTTTEDDGILSRQFTASAMA